MDTDGADITCLALCVESVFQSVCLCVHPKFCMIPVIIKEGFVFSCSRHSACCTPLVVLGCGELAAWWVKQREPVDCLFMVHGLKETKGWHRKKWMVDLCFSIVFKRELDSSVSGNTICQFSLFSIIGSYHFRVY